MDHLVGRGAVQNFVAASTIDDDTAAVLATDEVG
jgi:hypothetical protein